jgi:positive regulator of sigma E activity
MKGSHGEKITFWWSSKHGDTRTSTEESVRVFSGSNWLHYLILLPVLVVAVLLAIFFFAAFLALFVLAAISLGLRFWWLRRKLRKTADAQALEGDYVVIEKTHIIERKDGDTSEQ